MRKNETLPTLVVGGGVAGITAALDLAGNGQSVHLVESGSTLGGQVMNLDKVYPSDHCAFCPLWTEIVKCYAHPLITIHTSCRVEELKRNGSSLQALLIKKPPVIDAERCTLCARCETICPTGAAHPGGRHTYPPVFVIDREKCTTCKACVDQCPTFAIDLHRPEERIPLEISNVVWAAGFKEVDLSPLREFGYGSHPDIMTAMEFEEWIAEAGPNRGRVVKKCDSSIPGNIAFVQCAGARNVKFLPYCSAVCCMHALKQARWVVTRNPETRCFIFYTDLRTVGRDYYAYAFRERSDSSITLIRGRPSLIYPLPGGYGIAVHFEDTVLQEKKIWKFDMVVLNGNIGSSLRRELRAMGITPTLTSDGFVDIDIDDSSQIGSGFSVEPEDMTDSVIQASSAAIKTLTSIKKSDQRG